MALQFKSVYNKNIYLKKAFDTVKHDILLKKQQLYAATALYYNLKMNRYKVI